MAKSPLHVGKPKKNHANHAYAKERLNVRRQVALDNIEKRIKMKPTQILATAKRFRGRSTTDIDSSEIIKYVDELKVKKNELEKLIVF